MAHAVVTGRPHPSTRPLHLVIHAPDARGKRRKILAAVEDALKADSFASAEILYGYSTLSVDHRRNSPDLRVPPRTPADDAALAAAVEAAVREIVVGPVEGVEGITELRGLVDELRA